VDASKVRDSLVAAREREHRIEKDRNAVTRTYVLDPMLMTDLS
jgi:hypothetical protein